MAKLSDKGLSKPPKKRGGPRPKVRADDKRGGVPGVRGQVPYVVNDMHRAMVRKFAVCLTTPRLATKLGISETTLWRHYKSEIQNALNEEVNEVGSALLKQAKDGNVGAQIFFLRMRGGWAAPKGENGDSENQGDFDEAAHSAFLQSLTDDELKLYGSILDKYESSVGGDREAGTSDEEEGLAG